MLDKWHFANWNNPTTGGQVCIIIRFQKLFKCNLKKWTSETTENNKEDFCQQFWKRAPVQKVTWVGHTPKRLLRRSWGRKQAHQGGLGEWLKGVGGSWVGPLGRVLLEITEWGGLTTPHKPPCGTHQGTKKPKKPGVTLKTQLKWFLPI